MLISHLANFIYTKTSKTAGTSVEVFFEPYCMPSGEWSFSHYRDQKVSDAGVVGYRGENSHGKKWRNHMSAHEIRSKIKDNTWNSYFKFCVIRNPYDKAVSLYNWIRHRRNDNIKNMIKNLATSASTKLLKIDFQRWVNTISSDRDRYTIDGIFCMDDVIFFERLEEDTARVCNLLDLPTEKVNLPRLKTGIRSCTYRTADYYNSKSRQIVTDRFRPEIEAFGYSFPDSQTSPEPSQYCPAEVDWA